MGRARRASSFLFEPARYRTDPAVLGMSTAGRGAYSMLFCSAWDMPEPGVIPDDDRVLAQLAMVSPEEWSDLRPEVSEAFDLDSRPGCWVQRGLVRTVEAQDRFIASQSHAGHVAARARWDKKKHASASVAHEESHASELTPSVTDTDTEKTKALPSSAPVPETGVKAIPKRSSTQDASTARWREAFDRLNRAYPHVRGRSHRQVAERRWMALNPRPKLGDVANGLKAAKASDDWTRNDGHYVPALEVWIGKRGWESWIGPAASSNTNGAARAPQEGDRHGALTFLGGQWRSRTEAEQWGGA